MYCGLFDCVAVTELNAMVCVQKSASNSRGWCKNFKYLTQYTMKGVIMKLDRITDQTLIK